MTTNQTIGGVPRELLADLEDYGESGKAPEPWMVDKLRALLDAPACNECEDVGYHVTMGAQRSCWACKPAAQTQGEPVARVEIGADRDAVMTITDDNWLRSLKARGIHQIVPLYAEQPAPAAVAMPERLQQVLKFLEGAENLDGHWFGEPGPTGQIYWWRNELRKALAETNLFANQQ